MIKLGMKLFSTNCLQTPDFAASIMITSMRMTICFWN